MNFNPTLEPAILIKRYKRFLADIRLPNGKELTIHCPNTGSMRNCNAAGASVLFSDSGNDKRKYRHTFEAVKTPSGAWAGVNTGRANHLVREGIESGLIAQLQGYELIRAEVPYGEEVTNSKGRIRKKSRVDFLLENHPEQSDCYVEVKNVTLEVDAYRVSFPDAPTERGTKHLRDLMNVVEEGKRAALCFCVQHSTAETFSPAADIDPVYAQTLQKAIQAGVEVFAYGAEISAQRIRLNRIIKCE